jgi:hypothetical protein
MNSLVYIGSRRLGASILIAWCSLMRVGRTRRTRVYMLERSVVNELLVVRLAVVGVSKH